MTTSFYPSNARVLMRKCAVERFVVLSQPLGNLFPAGIVTNLSSRASLSRPQQIQPVPVHINDSLFFGDRISTEENARAESLRLVRYIQPFNDRSDPRQAGIDGLAKSNGSGEQIEVRTPNATINLSSLSAETMLAEVVNRAQ